MVSPIFIKGGIMKKILSTIGILCVGILFFSPISCTQSEQDSLNQDISDNGNGGGNDDSGNGPTDTVSNPPGGTESSVPFSGPPSGNGESTVITEQSQLLQLSDLEYLGAFRLPNRDDEVATFAYGGQAMTYYPDRDSLFIAGHPRDDGEHRMGNQVAEVIVPEIINSRNIENLEIALPHQGFNYVLGGFFAPYIELPQMGIAYLNTPGAGDKIHLAFGHHFHEEPVEQVPTHAWFDIDLTHPETQGAWYIGNRSLYSTNAYLFEVHTDFADTYIRGRSLATGRYRDGGWSGHGPAIHTYGPWLDGSPPANGTRLSEITLLQYSNSQEDNNITQAINNYQHADQWEGGAWITTSTGKSAVIFAGTKGTGGKYWYGWRNPAGTDIPCIETAMVDEFLICRMADKSSCPGGDFSGCTGHDDNRGWWSSRFDAQIVFYDPENFAAVVNETMQPYEPQPYATIDLDDHLYLQEGIEEGMIGAGDQRINRIGSIAFDRAGGRLFILEPFADDTRPVIHVWRVN